MDHTALLSNKEWDEVLDFSSGKATPAALSLLRSQGWTIVEIARTFRVSEKVISKALRGMRKGYINVRPAHVCLYKKREVAGAKKRRSKFKLITYNEIEGYKVKPLESSRNSPGYIGTASIELFNPYSKGLQTELPRKEKHGKCARFFDIKAGRNGRAL